MKSGKEGDKKKNYREGNQQKSFKSRGGAKEVQNADFTEFEKNPSCYVGPENEELLGLNI